MQEIDSGRSSCCHSGDGPTFVSDPITGISRRKQRREREKCHEGSSHAILNSTS